ncbi:hypothetical protein C5167_018873 [Papaver somniferum]|uniref:RING-type domain-containing protein n=1 Tax=Papaver somniferum TaxID=3469 RepID=A0A4Y7IP46_PAPSO|nr:BRCA1-associated protein-like [Papaver somniferum]RZC50447.1 hypothetical protein C5167_018873 [Papaver somniferum]
MFSIRVHSVDSNHPLGGEEEGWTTTTTSTTHSRSVQFTNPNFDIQQRKGIIHLYRNNNISSSTHSSSSLSSNPNNSRGISNIRNSSETTLLFVLAVPIHLSIYDFIHFCGSYIHHLSEILIIRNDVLEDRYSLLIKLVDQEKTDSFFRNFNGRPFSSTEAEICHILSIVSVEYTELTEIANAPPPGFTELPTCPVCLERLDQDTSGILTTVCDHSFQCPCISRWADSSCPVCRFCQQQTVKPTCAVCATQEDLWICLICGFVGCGRYKGRHAIRHWEDTKHCYSLDVEAQRVWDYVGDTYVHRLNQSKTDGKMADLNSRCWSVDGDCGPCSTCECSEDSGASGAVFGDRVETIVDEYNHLLASRLEKQREDYETLLAENKEKRGKFVLDEVEKAVNLKLQETQHKIEKCLEEKTAIASRNENLMKNQDKWRKTIMELEERERSSIALRDEKILDLEEQIRDLTVYVEAQKTLAKLTDSDGIKGGTVLPVPLQQQSSLPNTKRRSKTNKRR